MSLLSQNTHVVDVEVNTFEEQRDKSQKESWAAHLSDTECSIQTMSTKEVEMFSKKGLSVTHKVYFNTDVALNELHSLVNIRRKRKQNDDSHWSGKRLEFRGYADASAGFGCLWKGVFEEITNLRT